MEMVDQLVSYPHTPYHIPILHTTGQFKIRSSGRPGVYKLQNVAQPRCYLGYSKGYIIGHVSCHGYHGNLNSVL